MTFLENKIELFGANSNYELIDAHMHFSWIQDKVVFIEGICENKVLVFANTILPEQYKNLEKYSNNDNLRIGLGFHPWYATHNKLEEFLEFEKFASFIGEVGLDFSKKYKYSAEKQIENFIHICKNATAGSVISIHCVKTNGTTHAILRDTGVVKNCQIIYHSFLDDSQTLKHAIDDGCFFSISKKWLNSKRGKEYIKIIPQSQILPETDLPSSQDNSLYFKTYFSELQEIYNYLHF